MALNPGALLAEEPGSVETVVHLAALVSAGKNSTRGFEYSVDVTGTAIFDRPVVIGARGTEIPFVLIWDTDVSCCILEGIQYRRTDIYNVAGDGSITLREIARRLHKRYLPLPGAAVRPVNA